MSKALHCTALLAAITRCLSSLDAVCYPRLAQKELEHTATVSGALAAMKLDEESKVAQAVNQAKSEEQVSFSLW